MIKFKKINYESGQVMMTMVIFFLFASMVVVFGVVNPILKQVAVSKNLVISKESYYLASGALEDVIYRLKNGRTVDASETLSLNNATTTTVTANTATGKQVTSSADNNSNVRKLQANIILGTGVAFNYGVQSGRGGFVLQNSSSVTGNIYAGGSIVGSGNTVYGDIVSTGATGLVSGIHTTGSVFAHTIQGSHIDGDAYYMVKTNTVVEGVSHDNSEDQAAVELPISDEQIAEWEAEAEAGGIMTPGACDSYSAASNTCTISTSKTIGPIKIPFNLLIKSSNGILTVAGPLWVTGNITTQTGPTIRMSPGLGATNVAIIADNPANTTGSGLIDIGQTTAFQGSGFVGSFVFMISQNNSSESGGSTNAISMNQGASALVAYASHGQITLSQSVSVKEVTAFKIVLTQSANVTYDTGLPSVLFSGGPAGGYDVTSWQEVE